MKRSKTQLLRSLAAAMLLGTAFASCSQDDMPQTGGTPLPEGEYPLTLTARVDGMNTRATGKDAWVDGDKIGVRIGTNDATGCYELNPADGTVKKVITPVYWQNTDYSTVTAWYPYEKKIDELISDQSEGFADIDFLTATAPGQNYQSSVSLEFKHQMAKVSYTLKKGDGITDEELKEATVILMGNTTATFVNGALTEAVPESNGEIKSCYDGIQKTGAALLVPQNMTGQPFIKVRINGKDFIYTPPTETAGNLEAGSHNTYTITVKKDRIEVTGISASWNDDITEGSAGKPVFRVHLPEEHRQDLDFSGNVTKKDGYLEVEGNSFTISYAVTDQNRMKGFPIAEGNGEMERTMSGNDYTFAYTLRSDMRLGYDDYIQVGDYFYLDCTWRPDYVENKSCIGIVFKVGAGDGDAASNYDNKLTAIHGYVVALKDAHNASGAWGEMFDDVPDIPNEENFVKTYNGYANTLIVRALNTYSNVNVNNPTANTYWAFRVASDYNVSVPENSSGWYLPSIGQLADIYALPNRTDRFEAAKGSDFISNERWGSRYWSSTEKDNGKAWYHDFFGGGSGSRDKAGPNIEASKSYVRAVLTF